MNKLRVFDAFSGIGGFHLAFHQLGLECVFASEICEDARKSYIKNFSPLVSKNFFIESFNKDIYDLNYEDLINNPESKIREIITFCGLDWQDACLEYYKNKKSIKTVSFSQARKPIYKDSLKGTAKFKNYIQDLENALSSSKVR